MDVTDAPIVVTAPLFVPDWHPHQVVDPDSTLNGGYPVIPAMPRRRRLSLYVALYYTAAPTGTGTPGVWLSDRPFTSPTTREGIFLAVGPIGAISISTISPILTMEHTGAVFARKDYAGVTGAELILNWWSEIVQMQPTFEPWRPTLARDQAEGEVEATKPVPHRPYIPSDLDDAS